MTVNPNHQSPTLSAIIELNTYIYIWIVFHTAAMVTIESNIYSIFVYGLIIFSHHPNQSSLIVVKIITEIRESDR